MQPIRIKSARFLSSVLYGSVHFGEKVILGENVTIGYPKEARIEEIQKMNINDESEIIADVSPTFVGDICRIGSQVTIGEGCNIGNNTSIDDHCRIGFNCVIGENTRILYGAFICDRVIIGSGCKIAGFLGDAVEIDDDTTVMGQLVHEYTQPHVSWGIDEPAPKVKSRAVVGFGAIIVGGVTIGENSYIAAGAIVTKDVPSKSIVVGINDITPADQWRGRKLSSEYWTWR